MKYPYPVMYQNVYCYDEMKRAEHMAVRETVGWYLWTHQIVEVTGRDCTEFLELMFPKPIGNLSVSRERYTTMLDDQGQIIDDVVVMRMDEKRYWISTLFRADMLVWFDAHKGELDVYYEDITKNWEMYAVQGPKSLEMVNALTETPVDSQRFFQILPNRIDGIDVLINRAGFTGEKLGFEIYYPKDKAPEQEKSSASLRKLTVAAKSPSFKSWRGPFRARQASITCGISATQIPMRSVWTPASAGIKSSLEKKRWPLSVIRAQNGKW